jgi:hypothetical protein
MNQRISNKEKIWSYWNFNIKVWPLSCEYISSYNIHHWHTILTYTHKHITWTKAYTNTRVPQLKMSREISTIIKLMMQTHIVKPNPFHSENPSRCKQDTIARSSINSNYSQRSRLDSSLTLYPHSQHEGGSYQKNHSPLTLNMETLSRHYSLP